jgi:hypothetical protein
MVTWKTIQDNYNGKADHDRIQEDLNTEYGDELLREKGADPVKFRPGVAYHYFWVPFHVTLLAQAGSGVYRDAVPDAPPDGYKSLSNFGSYANTKPQEEIKITAKMAMWYNRYVDQKTGRSITINWDNMNDPFRKEVDRVIESLKKTFNEENKGFILNIIPNSFKADKPKDLLQFIATEADIKTVTGHSAVGANYLLDIDGSVDTDNKMYILMLYDLNLELIKHGSVPAAIDACGLELNLSGYQRLEPLGSAFYVGSNKVVKNMDGVIQYIKDKALRIVEEKRRK